MKVRLTADTLRLRLDQPDVDALSSSGTVDFTLPLDDAALRCILRVDSAADALSASLAEGAITVTLPADQAHRWIASDAVSLDGTVDAAGATTRILIEKDLGCRHTDEGSAADATPTFDHLRDSSSDIPA